MEVEIISEFLTENNWANHIDHRLRPARIILDCLDGIQVGICIPDGCLVLEDLTKVCNRTGFQPLAVIDLADPDSLDSLLKAVERHCEQDRRPVGTGPDSEGGPADADGGGLRGPPV